ncbi:hypothetical protein C8J56DRAFT_927206 [Mycena floridula]|nr:hypothetical protein C8J56DRAFT_927206 [Mycena floridula]
MSSRRDFPSASIGRTQGRLTSNPSHESLNLAHPLLSPNNSLSSPDTARSYVPYTPRQRVPTPAATTTGTTLALPSVSSSASQPDATSKLQLMNLKAATQNVGLDAGSVGWAILEKLVSGETDNHAEWTEIWSIVTSGKATLLLPLEQLPSSERITPEFVKDHVVLCDSASRKTGQVVTLSGLRGTMLDDALTFRSSLSPTSTAFQNLLATSASLATLPPLPLISPKSIYPSFHLPAHTSSLPLPPRPPHLPPRPVSKSGSGQQAATSRLTNPFASLFGKTSTPPTFPLSLPASQSTPPASAVDVPLASPAISEHATTVSAFIISHRLVFSVLAKDINRALKSEVKEYLQSLTILPSPNSPLLSPVRSESPHPPPRKKPRNMVPPWVIEKVNDFTSPLFPFMKPRRKEASRKEGSSPRLYVANPVEESPEDLAEMVQEFFATLDADLKERGVDGRKNYRVYHRQRDKTGSDDGTVSTSNHSVYSSTADDEDEKETAENDHDETRASQIMEAVEKTICELFYDRFFLLPLSDDSSHDEALSSRVAALNMLDLGLEHLDICVTSPDKGVQQDAKVEKKIDKVVRSCGDLLSKLHVCRNPAGKAAIMVEAHKLVVEGLSRLPPIRLKSEMDEASPPPPTLQPAVEEAKTSDESPNLTIDAPSPAEENSPMLILSPPPSMESNSASEGQDPVTPSLVIPLPASPQIPTLSPLFPDTASLPATPDTSTSTTNAISGDVLFPFIIFSVVKSNPPHLVSNLLFTQRFRNRSIGGEESYCLINLMAVAEFLENVDMGALGLEGGGRVMSTADLTPIPVLSPLSPDAPSASSPLVGGIRTQVDTLTAGAGKVLTGVVDSSFGMLRAFMPTGASANVATPPIDGVQSAAPWNNTTTVLSPKSAGFGLLRREGASATAGSFGFNSLLGIVESLPGVGGGAAAKPQIQNSGEELVEVQSRPGSIRSRISAKLGAGSDLDIDSETSDVEDESDEDGEQEDDDDEKEVEGGGPDTRSIKSFESMMHRSKSRKTKKKKVSTGTAGRKSLSDRLARVSSSFAINKPSPASSVRSATLPSTRTHVNEVFDLGTSRPVSPNPVPEEKAIAPSLSLSPPNSRFLECAAGDLRISEVEQLLLDYRRLVEGIQQINGFRGP